MRWQGKKYQWVTEFLSVCYRSWNQIPPRTRLITGINVKRRQRDLSRARTTVWNLVCQSPVTAAHRAVDGADRTNLPSLNSVVLNPGQPDEHVGLRAYAVAALITETSSSPISTPASTKNARQIQKYTIRTEYSAADTGFAPPTN